jgi:hypothetical protein
VLTWQISTPTPHFSLAATFLLPCLLLPHGSSPSSPVCRSTSWRPPLGSLECCSMPAREQGLHRRAPFSLASLRSGRSIHGRRLPMLLCVQGAAPFLLHSARLPPPCASLPHCQQEASGPHPPSFPHGARLPVPWCPEVAPFFPLWPRPSSSFHGVQPCTFFLGSSYYTKQWQQLPWMPRFFFIPPPWPPLRRGSSLHGRPLLCAGRPCSPAPSLSHSSSSPHLPSLRSSSAKRRCSCKPRLPRCYRYAHAKCSA